jgi:integrase
MLNDLPDSLQAWINRYLQLAVVGIRSAAVSEKIELHLTRFQLFFATQYGHDRITTWLKRDVIAWQAALLSDQKLAHATINNHLASLSGFASWVETQAPQLLPAGHPVKGVGELPLPPLEPRTLDERQIQSLKNLCDRLLPFYRHKGRRWAKATGETGLRTHARPWRDRAIVFVLLSTGLRREELVKLNLDQVSPHTPAALRQVKRARIQEVQGKGKTQRDVFLSSDARQALADYLEKEHALDSSSLDEHEVIPLFLSAASVASRQEDGRLSPRSINTILGQIGRWHDAELSDPDRHISPLRPHDLRHTFAFQLARVTGADAYELERRLGHRSKRYIQRYTNPPENVAAGYIESF